MKQYITTYTVRLHTTGDTLPNMPENGAVAMHTIAEAIWAGADDCQLESIEEFDEDGESLGGIFREDAYPHDV